MKPEQDLVAMTRCQSGRSNDHCNFWSKFPSSCVTMPPDPVRFESEFGGRKVSSEAGSYFTLELGDKISFRLENQAARDAKVCWENSINLPQTIGAAMNQSRHRRSRKVQHTFRIESLERRNLLAGDLLHNYLTPEDVNDDQYVSAIDVLTIVNRINHSEASGADTEVDSASFLDVNDDGYASAIDALMVINQLNSIPDSTAATSGKLSARLSGPAGEQAKVEIENQNGSFQLEVKIQNALAGESFEASVGGQVVATLVTNSRGRASFETFLAGAAADTIAAANAGTNLGISGIGASVFAGEHANEAHSEHGDSKHGDSKHGDNDHKDNDHKDNDHEDNDGHNDDAKHDPSIDTGGNDSDSDDGLNNSGNSDSSYDSDDGPGHVNDDATGDSQSDIGDGPLTASVPGTIYGEWKARLTGTGVGKAEFEIEQGEMELKVEVQGLAANSTFPVSVRGFVIGQLRTNSRGKGELKFEIGDDDHRPFPPSFPLIAAGTSVAVGDRVSGVFSAKLNDDDRDNHDDDDHDG